MRAWICWGVIAGSAIVVIAWHYHSVEQLRQLIIELDVPPRGASRAPTRAPDWLIAPSCAITAAFLAVCLTRRGRVRLRMRPRLARPSAHGGVYLEAFAMAWGIQAVGIAAVWAGWAWRGFFYSGWVGAAVALIHAFLKSHSIRIPFAEWGWRRGRGIWRELAIGLVAGVVLRSVRVLPDAVAESTATFTILSSVVLAPIIEETLYRGMLYRNLRDHLRWPLAVLISAAVFAVVHLPVSRWPYVFVGGIGYALLREWRGSLIAPVAAHAAGNLLYHFEIRGVFA